VEGGGRHGDEDAAAGVKEGEVAAVPCSGARLVVERRSRGRPSGERQGHGVGGPMSGDEVGKKEKKRKGGPHSLVVAMKEKYEGGWMREKWIRRRGSC
jgi:hypothetical protein